MPARTSVANGAITDSCYGLFVGVSEFDDQEYRKHPIPNATADAGDVRDSLVDGWNWAPSHTIVLPGRVGFADVKTGFRQLWSLLGESKEPPTCVIYFSTHGHLYSTQNPDYPPLKSLILLTSDARVTNADPITALDGLSQRRLESYVQLLPAARKVIILDACYSAVVPVTGVSIDDIYQPLDAAVLASSRLESRFNKAARNSEFTGLLLKHLQRPASELSVITLFGAVAASFRKIKGAPKPILRFAGADIVLGVSVTAPKTEATIASIVQAFDAETRVALSAKSSLSLGTYVPRPEVEGLFSEFLIQKDRPAFTLVAAAGNGKSTSMRELAARCLNERYAVLWFPEPRLERHLDFERFIASMLPTHAERSLSFLEKLEKPLIVFFDGINEWPNVDALPSFFARVIALSHEYRFRIVVSCRELSWTRLGKAFTAANTFAPSNRSSPLHGLQVSASLPVFDEGEVQTALAPYPRAQAFVSAHLIRHPIFIAVLLRTIRYLEEHAESITLSTILGEYVRIKVQQAAKRLNLETRDVSERVHALSGEMFAAGLETVDVDKYFDVTGSAIGTALLDEALFISSSNGITTEMELILDYLISQRLPNDPLADFEAFEGEVERFPRVKGAVLLRLSEMRDEAALNVRLMKLDEAGYTAMLVEMIRYLPSLSPYENLFQRLFRQIPAYVVTDALRPIIKRDFGLCLRAAHQLFEEVHYYDWELKRWEDMPFESFREKLSVQANSDEARFLLDCIEAVPSEGLRVLLEEWLLDNSSLEGGSYATIAGVASVYLRAFAQVHAEELLNLLDRELGFPEWQPSPQIVLSIIKTLARCDPAHAAEHALGWMAEPRNFPAAVTVLDSLPVSYAQAIDQLGRRLVEQKLDRDVSNHALSSVARMPSGSILEFVRACAMDALLWPGVLAAAYRMYSAFPKETFELIEKLARQPSLPSSAAETAVRFYCQSGNFFAFENYADYILSTRIRDEQLVDSLFAAAVQNFSLQDAAVRDWSERWLKLAPTGWAIEYLAGAIRKVRSLTQEDLLWLERWVTYPHARYYPDWIVEADLPVQTAAELLVTMVEKVGLATSNVGPSDKRLQQIASILVADPRFATFPNAHQAYWKNVATGQ